MNSRYLCPLHTSDCAYICVSVSAPEAVPKMSLCVPIPCIDPYVVSMYITTYAVVLCPGVPTTVHLVGEQVYVFYVYACMSVYLVCAPKCPCVCGHPYELCVCVFSACALASSLRLFLLPLGCSFCFFACVCLSLECSLVLQLFPCNQCLSAPQCPTTPSRECASHSPLHSLPCLWSECLCARVLPIL